MNLNEFKIIAMIVNHIISLVNVLKLNSPKSEFTVIIYYYLLVMLIISLRLINTKNAYDLDSVQFTAVILICGLQ
jgi:hypothetical protein